MTRVAVVVLLLTLASEAAAHPLAPGLLEIQERADATADVAWATPVVQPSGEALTPVLPDGCRPLAPPLLTTEEARLVQRWRVACPAGWVGSTIAVRGLATAKTAVVVRVTLADGDVASGLLTTDHPSFLLPVRPTRTAVARDYLVLGIEHMLGGLDHLAFVIGLTWLVRRRRTLVTTVTAFTLGHSVTLALAVLGVVRLPVGPIEAAIAASIMVLAAEIVVAERGEAGLLARRPELMALAFGLLHGLGFAGALAESGLPTNEIPLALLSFNVGIEIGQLAVVAAAIAVRRPLRRLRRGRLPLLDRVPAYALGSLAAFWCCERLQALLQ